MLFFVVFAVFLCVFCLLSTSVVQQNDHVVPSQAVVGLQHRCVPPCVQGIHMSVLVCILSGKERKNIRDSPQCKINHSTEGFFSFFLKFCSK